MPATQPAPPAPQEPTQTTFSFLNGFAAVKPPKNAGMKQGDPLTAAKRRVIDGLCQQKERGQLVMDGKPLPKMDGGKKTVATWFYKAPDGAYATRLRYGRSAIPLSGDNTAVRVGDLKDLLPFYDPVIAAVERGELDEPLARMQKEKSAALMQGS
jgi:hypothetical protein